MRGGTSKAIIFRQRDLPADRNRWDSIFLRAMGSPDPYGRQLDGMGGGLSSVSKVCVVGPPTRPDANVDFTFAQVSIKEGTIDYSGNCGNMSSAIGPFSIDEGLVNPLSDGTGLVRIHNTNTSKIIVSKFAMDGDKAAVEGDFSIDGVAGTGAPVRLEFLDPGGSKTAGLLPTGHPTDVLDVPGLGRTDVSLVDAGNPFVFVKASALGKRGTELPDELERDAKFMMQAEALRLAGSVAMRLAPDVDGARAIPSIPRVALVAPPCSAVTLSGQTLQGGDMNISIRMISSGQPHRAIPITGALCVAVAARIPGTVTYDAATPGEDTIRIGQPSGITVVDARICRDAKTPGGIRAEYVALYRTTRRLFDGYVLLPNNSG
jgi:hypothetical protein